MTLLCVKGGWRPNIPKHLPLEDLVREKLPTRESERPDLGGAYWV